MGRLFTDMLSCEVRLDGPPRRIVSLVPSQTELLHDLGLEREVVGITKFCVHPRSWFRSKKRVGGTKQVHTDLVAALQPDLIIANKEENVREQVMALSAIAPVWTSDVRTLGDALEMIRAIGWLTDRAARADRIAALIHRRFAALPSVAGTPQKVAYGIWRDPWMWAGGDTFISDVLARAGWQNVLEGAARYPEVAPEDLKMLRPDLILLSSEPYPFKERHMAEISAVLPDARILLADGELFSWYGSRLLRTPAYLKSLILAVHG